MRRFLAKLETHDILLMIYVVLVLFATFVFVGLITPPVAAQDTAAPQWEYAVLFYSSDDVVVYTDDPVATSELNSQFTEDGESVGLLTGMNIVGADGWELVDIVPGATSVYVFKREK